MNAIIRTLELIGQSNSIKQFSSLNDMKSSIGIDNNILSKIENTQVEYVCHQSPPDEEDK